MELVGKIISYDRQPKSCHFIFRCTNKEEMTIKQAPAISNLPENILLRIFTVRPQLDDGRVSREHVLVQWQRFDNDDEIYIMDNHGKQKTVKFVKEDI